MKSVSHNIFPGIIEVWQIELGAIAVHARAYCEILSKDENQRASRFRFEQDKARFISAHVAMRSILSQYLNVAPEEITFSYGAHGKPELASALSESGLRFSLSHSREWALLAVSMNSRIGADVEYIDSRFAREETAEVFFSAQEVATLRALPSEVRAAAFFSCWTRKEAYLKAIGGGLSVSLDSFAVAFGPNVPASLIWVSESRDEQWRWTMYDVPSAQGYAAAVVAEGLGHRLCNREWEWST